MWRHGNDAIADDSCRREVGYERRNATYRCSVQYQAIKNSTKPNLKMVSTISGYKKNSTIPNLRMVSMEQRVPVGGADVRRRGHGSDVTWRGQLGEEDCTATIRCSRRDEGIVCKVRRLVLCTSPRTSSVLDDIRSLFFICVYWIQPVFYHLGIPRGIYRDVSSGLFTEMLIVDHILPIFLRE